MNVMEYGPRISPFLWFDTQAEEAADFYVGIFPNSRRLETFREPRTGQVLTVAFELDGQKFTALNGGPTHAHFTEAISFTIRCDSQKEVDNYWSRLTEGGQEVACGWLKDKFGLCWQVVPARIMELIRHPKAMEAMLKMKKFDIAALEAAAKE